MALHDIQMALLYIIYLRAGSWYSFEKVNSEDVLIPLRNRFAALALASGFIRRETVKVQIEQWLYTGVR
ncbi:hypothetical protein EVAR_57592_1 [Eumeta japonica]|uniref:Uncharacterized protein n=1 Tax=Eumeta variegata TaxID=151549 RepID=A0A4C1XXF7_EUMVA|nr:hypothetical protein EVAR_57592_1 [Eumeta japonica]